MFACFFSKIDVGPKEFEFQMENAMLMSLLVSCWVGVPKISRGSAGLSKIQEVGLGTIAGPFGQALTVLGDREQKPLSVAGIGLFRTSRTSLNSGLPQICRHTRKFVRGAFLASGPRVDKVPFPELHHDEPTRSETTRSTTHQARPARIVNVFRKQAGGFCAALFDAGWGVPAL
ncbi:hypothetical protein BKA67DRAFT_531787 [Truncatella angustata]|uniref:Uncharacterized protein n=1 Tax=Truncatella angustata TaxID=152316 RepID=A0A9P8ZYW3_9PEZI|nr:uncharacterized protein BKA67DRAFT_531787 [Truncatella angustata]KAH6656522.1 hypothetical protein BKA67DRAFT_531787 [Truncatella angustata]